MRPDTVQFYHLKTPHLRTVLRFVTHRIPAIWDRGDRIHIHTPDLDTQQQQSDLLWSTFPERFLAHAVLPDPRRTVFPPITLSAAPLPCLPLPDCTVWIHITSALPVSESPCVQRHIEILWDDPSVKDYARLRYAHYRTLGSVVEYLEPVLSMH